jgi:hypothetical protein
MEFPVQFYKDAVNPAIADRYRVAEEQIHDTSKFSVSEQTNTNLSGLDLKLAIHKDAGLRHRSFS